MKVLLVEDNQRERDEIKKLLEGKHFGFAVDAAPDATKAIEYVSRDDYTAGIVDLHLEVKSTHMEGLDLIRNIRRLRRQFPILVLTFRYETETEVEVFSAGANDFVIKPLVPEVLLARIYNMIGAVQRRNQTEKAYVLERGPIKLDIMNAKVHVEGKQVDLTPREFSLLRYLMVSEGAVDMDEIISYLWNDDERKKITPDKNNVANLISRLKKKLDPEKRIAPISSAREIAGYRMNFNKSR